MEICHDKCIYLINNDQKNKRKKISFEDNIKKNNIDYSKEKKESNNNQSKNLITSFKKLEKNEEIKKNKEDNNSLNKLLSPEKIINDNMKLIFFNIIKSNKENIDLNSSNIVEDNSEIDDEFFLQRAEKIRYSYIEKLISKACYFPNNNLKNLYNSLIVFDWDDTLFPTSYLAGNGYFSKNNFLPKKEEEKILKKIEKLEKNVIELINLSLRKGKVYIITNAVSGWVEYTSYYFYPNFYKILDKIKIISARRDWEDAFPDNIIKWKMQAFLNLKNFFNNTFVTNIICLGDSMLEIEAGKFLANCFKEAFIKTIKFKENPKPEELNKQLTLVINQFNTIHSSIKNLTVKVEKRKGNENK